MSRRIAPCRAPRRFSHAVKFTYAQVLVCAVSHGVEDLDTDKDQLCWLHVDLLQKDHVSIAQLMESQ